MDGNGRPLSIVVTGGQRHDGAMLPAVLGDIRVPRMGPGGLRTRPDTVLADRGYTSAINRTYLRSRGVSAVVPENPPKSAHGDANVVPGVAHEPSIRQPTNTATS